MRLFSKFDVHFVKTAGRLKKTQETQDAQLEKTEMEIAERTES